MSFHRLFKSIFICAIILSGTAGLSQGNESGILAQRHEINLMSYRTGLAMLGQTTSPFSGQAVEYGRTLAERPLWRLHYQYRVSAAGFYHEDFFSGLSGSVQAGLGWHASNGFSIRSLLGLGYVHSFSQKSVYTQTDSGEFEQVRDWGVGRPLIPGAIELSWQMPDNSALDSIVLGYRVALELFVSPGLPLLPHDSLIIGVRF